MNEKIEELIEQAWTYQVRVFNEPDGTRTFSEKEKVFDKEKFAELIVRECAGLCSEIGNAHMSDLEGTPEFGAGAYFSAERIKQYFGVEE